VIQCVRADKLRFGAVAERTDNIDLVSDVLSFGRLWYTKPDDAIGYAKFRSRSNDAVIHVYDAAGNVIDRLAAI